MSTESFQVRHKQHLFGKTELGGDPVFTGADAGGLFDFFQQGFQGSSADDPRLTSFLDKAIREMDRSFKAAQDNFDRGLDGNQRRSGDAAAFNRDIAIARSEQGSAAITDILGLLEQLKLEAASGALAFLTAESQEQLGIADFEMKERAANNAAANAVFGNIMGIFSVGGGSAPSSAPDA